MLLRLLAPLCALSMFGAELKIDHVTVAGRHLRQMQDALTAGAGIPTENGGPHSNHATEMALASFPDGSYLELIAIQPDADPKAMAEHTWNKFLNGDAGPCGWAVQVPDVSAEARRLLKAGIKVSPPAKSGRTRTDGVRIGWDIAQVGPGAQGTFFPFLIRDLTPREIRAYPSGKPTTKEFRGIAKVVIAVKNLGESVQLYQRAYDFGAPKMQKDPEFGAELAWFEGTPVVIASPLSPGSALAARVREFGDAPYAFVLAASSVGTATRSASSNWFGKPIRWFDTAKLGWHLGVE